jgi:hypothetical protein
MKVYPNDDPDTAAKRIHEDWKKEGWFSIPKNKAKDKPKEKEERKGVKEITLTTYKYSRRGKGELYESVMLGGIPTFLRYDEKNDKLVPHQQIDEEYRMLRPPRLEEYPYTPYEFSSIEELDEYLEYAKKQSIDSLYILALDIVKLYNDQDEDKQILMALDIVWTYFQDKFPTTHYLCVTGDNDSGKSTVGNTFEAIAYRCVNMTNPSAPNVFRVLGTIEAGQCTLVLDESDRIDQSPEMMSILKTGYDHDKKVVKVNTNILKQEWFWTFGMKIIVAEKSPNQYIARGVLDRTFSFTTYAGSPQADIKEVIDPQGDPCRTRLYDKLVEFRKLMLVYRLIHFKDSIPDIDINVRRRNKELCKPYIQLFYGSESQREVEQTLEKFLQFKSERKAASIENALLPLVINLIDDEGNPVPVSRIWEKISSSEIQGQLYGDEFHSEDYGILYRNSITKLLHDKFGAERERLSGKRALQFDSDKLQKMQESYSTEIKINTTLKAVRDEYDRYDSYDSISDPSGTVSDLKNTENKELSIVEEEKPLEDETINSNTGTASSIDLSNLSNLSSYNSDQFKCYHPGCNFHTENEGDYRKHGVQKHPNNPLLYPSKAEIEHYGLEAQGKEWEI